MAAEVQGNAALSAVLGLDNSLPLTVPWSGFPSVYICKAKAARPLWLFSFNFRPRVTEYARCSCPHPRSRRRDIRSEQWHRYIGFQPPPTSSFVGWLDRAVVSSSRAFSALCRNDETVSDPSLSGAVFMQVVVYFQVYQSDTWTTKSIVSVNLCFVCAVC